MFSERTMKTRNIVKDDLLEKHNYTMSSEVSSSGNDQLLKQTVQGVRRAFQIKLDYLEAVRLEVLSSKVEFLSGMKLRALPLCLPQWSWPGTTASAAWVCRKASI
jgi:hypothetical protein